MQEAKAECLFPLKADLLCSNSLSNVTWSNNVLESTLIQLSNRLKSVVFIGQSPNPKRNSFFTSTVVTRGHGPAHNSNA